MKIKWDGRSGVIRYQTPRGKTSYSARLGNCRTVIAQNVLAGWGRDFEVRIIGNPTWHSVSMTMEEAEEIVRRSAVAQRDKQAKVDRCLNRQDYSRMAWALKEVN